MADSKISALTALTGTPADDDVFAVVDTSATATKKITFATLNAAVSATVAADDIGIGNAAVSIATSAGNITIDAQAGDTDIIFKGTDNTSDITALTLDMSEAGAATFNDKITAVGTSVFTNLDISGDVDVDGTTNLDVVDIDGAVDMASTLTVAEAINGALKRWTAKTANYTAVAGDRILANTAGGVWTLTLPASPAVGDEIHILDAAASFDDNTLTVARNSLKIQGLTADLSLTTQNTGIGLVYMSATYGWRVLIDAYDVVTTEL